MFASGSGSGSVGRKRGRGDGKRGRGDGSKREVKLKIEDPLKKLRACLRCFFLQKFELFLFNGCPNCPFLEMELDEQRARDCTTTEHGGYIGLIQRDGYSHSFLCNLIKGPNDVDVLLPVLGGYAANVTGHLPDDLLILCEDLNKRYKMDFKSSVMGDESYILV